MNEAEQLETKQLPSSGVWRVASGPDPFATKPPLTPDELSDPTAGNRFDSPTGEYGVLYFGTQLEACFGETLSRFRPDPSIVPLVQGEWSEQGFMLPGEIPANWRHRRLAVRARLADKALAFLDVESARTRATLARRLAPLMAAAGVSDLDVSAIRSGDRRITRAIGYWAWLQRDEEGPLYAGVRYLSQLNSDWECWALFDRVPTVEIERRSVTHEMQELAAVASLYGLRVY